MKVLTGVRFFGIFEVFGFFLSFLYLLFSGVSLDGCISWNNGANCKPECWLAWGGNLYSVLVLEKSAEIYLFLHYSFILF